MSKKLVFDTTDANTILDSDSVGAFLRSSDGTLLTHSDVGGKKALDVSIADGVNVEVDLSHVDDSVALGDGTSLFTSTSENGDIALDVHISNTEIAVTQGSDSPWTVDGTVAATQSGTWTIDSITNVVSIDDNAGSITVDDGGSSLTVDGTVSISGDVNVTQGTSPWVVSATQLDIDDLDAATDSVASHLFDGAGTALTSTLVGADQALDINVVQSVDPSTANSSILSAVDTLASGGTAETVVASALANRKRLFVYNNYNRTAYIGGSGVSSANGFPLPPQAYMELAVGPAVDVYYDGQTNTEIRTLEIA